VDDAIRSRAYEISRGPEAGTPEENWLRAEREFAVAHDYDTLDRDLELLGMALSRLPSEAGVEWRLTLPRGERVEAWEPGNNGLSPPHEILRLIGGVLAGKTLIPGPPPSTDLGAVRLRALLAEQRAALLEHEPGARLGHDPENLHRHRVAARRVRTVVRAARKQLDPGWRRVLDEGLRELNDATGPVRDLDVLLEHLHDELAQLDEGDREAGTALVDRLEHERDAARRRLLTVLDGDRYAFVITRLRLPPRLADDVDTIAIERIARNEFRRLGEAVAALGKRPSNDAMHALRITLKRARNAAELAASKGSARRRFLDDARVFQDLLGEHQDALVAERRLRAAAVDDASTAAAFVAGRIAERQRARRARVQKRLPAAWKRLRKSGARLA
jgi:CHAD domain-containing protein